MDWLAASEAAVDALPAQFADRDAIQAAADAMQSLDSECDTHAAQLERLATLSAPLLEPRNSAPLLDKQIAVLRQRHAALKSRVEQQLSRVAGLCGTHAALDAQIQSSRDALLNAGARVDQLNARVLAAVTPSAGADGTAVPSDEAITVSAALKDELQVLIAHLFCRKIS